MHFSRKIFLFLGILSSYGFSPSSSLARVWPLEECERIFLAGKTIRHFIHKKQKKEKEKKRKKNQKDSTSLKELKDIKSCSQLLQMASLKENGLLSKRSSLSSTILETFAQRHTQWLMPKDWDRTSRCSDFFEWDIYDIQSPAYHFVRALFQRERKASMAITAYGDLRIVRKGINPEISPLTHKEAKAYKKALSLPQERPFNFVGKGEILGFLYQRGLKIPLDSSLSSKIQFFDIKDPSQFNIRKHFGAGALGSPSYLYFHTHQKAWTKSDGKRKLPRGLAHSIFENFLCSSPQQFYAKELSQLHTLPQIKKERSPPPTPWKHPLTQEKNCLKCHLPLDHMAAGLRNLSFISSSKKCRQEDPSLIQVLFPVFYKKDHAQKIWMNSPEDFAMSYSLGYLRENRFFSLSQLGKLLSQQPEFYSCQIKRYYKWFYNKEIPQQKLKELTSKYQRDQDGLALLHELIKIAP